MEKHEVIEWSDCFEDHHSNGEVMLNGKTVRIRYFFDLIQIPHYNVFVASIKVISNPVMGRVVVSQDMIDKSSKSFMEGKMSIRLMREILEWFDSQVAFYKDKYQNDE